MSYGPYIRSPGTGLWYPRHPELPGFVPMALGESLEDLLRDMTAPTAQDFSEQLISAIGSVRSDGDALVSSWELPVKASVSALTTAVEATAGRALGDLLKFTDVAGIKISSMLTGFLNRDMDLVVEAVTQQVANTIAEAMSVVPVLGDIARGLLGVFAAIFGRAPNIEELKGDALKAMFEALKPECDAAVFFAKRMSESTRSTGEVDPADAFRPVAYAYQKGGRLPICAASMYVSLCGGVTEGFGWRNEADYQRYIYEFAQNPSWVTTIPIVLPGGRRTEVPNWSKKSSKAPPGIPIETRRKMWEVIKGIMKAVVLPGARMDIVVPGDGGRSLMPFLQETVRQALVREEFGSVDVNGNLDYPHMLMAHSTFITKQFKKGRKVSSGDKWAHAHGNCAAWDTYVDMHDPARVISNRRVDWTEHVKMEPLVRLDEIFSESIRGWRNRLAGDFGWDPVKRQYDLSKIPRLGMSAKKATGMLVVKKKQTEKLKREIDQIKRVPAKTSTGQKFANVMLATGAAVGGGYLAYAAADALFKGAKG